MRSNFNENELILFFFSLKTFIFHHSTQMIVLPLLFYNNKFIEYEKPISLNYTHDTIHITVLHWQLCSNSIYSSNANQFIWDTSIVCYKKNIYISEAKKKMKTLKPTFRSKWLGKYTFSYFLFLLFRVLLSFYFLIQYNLLCGFLFIWYGRRNRPAISFEMQITKIVLYSSYIIFFFFVLCVCIYVE